MKKVLFATTALIATAALQRPKLTSAVTAVLVLVTAEDRTGTS